MVKRFGQDNNDTKAFYSVFIYILQCARVAVVRYDRICS